MMNLPWSTENLSQFTSLVQSQRVPHAILLSSPKGMGKFELAKQMAQLAMCENITQSGACFACSACDLLKAGNHTDLSVIKAESAVIKVAQIRKLTSDVVLTASKNQHKVIIIKEAEKMNASSANALLKTLEEPPQKVVIILTTSEVGRLLPTIKSRCVKIAIKPASQGLVKQWLDTQVSTSEENIAFAQLLANNSPLLARSILLNSTLDDIKQMIKDLEGLKQQSLAVLEVSKKWYANSWHLHLNFIAVILLNQIAWLQNLKNETENSYGVNVAVNELEFLGFVKSIHLYSKRIELPLKAELQLERLLFLWKNG